MSSIPRDAGVDNTLALLSEGYTFISRRCERLRSDIFETRLMLQRAVCTQGEDAAQMFYHPDRFTRKRSMPPNVLMLLQDKGSVQVTDGETHRHRKKMFMSLMSRGAIQQLSNLTAEYWRSYVDQWKKRDRVVLHKEVQEILCRAVCQWAGVPLSESEVEKRTRALAAMIDGAGSVGPRNWKGLLLRSRTERWMRGIIEKVRAGEMDVPEGSAAYAMAWHRNPDGELLDKAVAAVELINMLRPTVAVARYIVFAALALHDNPPSRQELEDDEGDYLELFVQEVRRFYPFFPFVAGRARSAFEWKGHQFAKGAWVLLDLYGTNHDERIWEQPEAFNPDRFREWDESPFNFIPQGGGDHYDAHRCAGEWITIALVQRAVHLLVHAMEYEVPDQNLSIDLSRMPAIPESRFVISNVRAKR